MRKASLVLLLACLFGFGGLAYAQTQPQPTKTTTTNPAKEDSLLDNMILKAKKPEIYKPIIKQKNNSGWVYPIYNVIYDLKKEPVERVSMNGIFNDDMGGFNAAYFRNYHLGARDNISTSDILEYKRVGDEENTSWSSMPSYGHNFGNADFSFAIPTFFSKGTNKSESQDTSSRSSTDAIQNGLAWRYITQRTDEEQKTRNNGQNYGLGINIGDKNEKVTLEGRVGQENATVETKQTVDYNEAYTDSTHEKQGGFDIWTSTTSLNNILTDVNVNTNTIQKQRSLRFVYTGRIPESPISLTTEAAINRENETATVNTTVNSSTDIAYNTLVRVDGNGRSDTTNIAGTSHNDYQNSSASEQRFDESDNAFAFGLQNPVQANPNGYARFEYHTRNRRVKAEGQINGRFGKHKDWLASFYSGGFDGEYTGGVGIGNTVDYYGNMSLASLEALANHDRAEFRDIPNSVLYDKLSREQALKDAEMGFIDNLYGYYADAKVGVQKGKLPESRFRIMNGQDKTFEGFEFYSGDGVNRNDYEFKVMGGSKKAYGEFSIRTIDNANRSEMRLGVTLRR